MDHPTCSVEGCPKPGRSKAPGVMCKMHYHRWYRHRDLDRTAKATTVTASLGRRYRTVPAKGHPVAMANGRAYEHRFVLYERIGPGPHECHWCGTEVRWAPKGDPPFELQPDHLNNDGADNRPENLAPSCRSCNITRGLQRRSDALREAGWWSGSDTVARLSRGGRVERVAA